MHTYTNYRTKKELREAVARGDKVRLQPQVLGYDPGPNATNVVIEGPHEGHRWYAKATLTNGLVTEVK